MAPLTINPIGYIRTAMRSKFDAPHQPEPASTLGGVIELEGGSNYEAALRDLVGFERIWLVWWFHKNKDWRPTVVPPRGRQKKRGVFATRSPHRPNPIGLTAVPLIRVKGRKLEVGPCDLVDGTPILDIKPYIPGIDAFPTAKYGWVEELDRAEHGEPRFQVSLSERAQAQAVWLNENYGINFLSRAIEKLQQDPSPHRTRRISKLPTGVSRMGCGPWRLFFLVNEAQVLINELAPGYPASSLLDAGQRIVDREAQLAFMSVWDGAERN